MGEPIGLFVFDGLKKRSIFLFCRNSGRKIGVHPRLRGGMLSLELLQGLQRLPLFDPSLDRPMVRSRA